MREWHELGERRTRKELRVRNAVVGATSDGLGWSSAYATAQREQPFEAELSDAIDCLLIVHRSGPVNVTLRVGSDRAVTQQRRSGQLSFIPGSCNGSLALHAPHDTLHIYLRPELFGDSKLTPLLGVVDPVLDNLAASIEHAMRDRIPGSALYIEPIAQAIADRILQVAGGRTSPTIVGRLSDRQLRRVREFVEANLEENIELGDMARACGVGAKTLQRGFKEATGSTPYQYVLARRVEKARELLADRSQSLSEVAVRCGFCHLEHLTRVFQKFTGQSPGLYRHGVERG